MEPGRRLGDHYDLKEGPPQVPALLRWISKSIQDPMSDLIPAGARKRLAGWPSGKQFYISILYELPDPSNELGIAEVPVEG